MEANDKNTPNYEAEATQLETMNAKINQGRSFGVVQMLVDDIRRGDYYTARVNAHQQGDKWASVDPDIKFFLQKNVFKEDKPP